MNEGGSPTAAFRASLPPAGAQPRPTAQAVRGRALALGLQGWVRGDAGPGDPLAVHAEGDRMRWPSWPRFWAATARHPPSAPRPRATSSSRSEA